MPRRPFEATALITSPLTINKAPLRGEMVREISCVPGVFAKDRELLYNA